VIPVAGVAKPQKPRYAHCADAHDIVPDPQSTHLHRTLRTSFACSLLTEGDVLMFGSLCPGFLRDQLHQLMPPVVTCLVAKKLCVTPSEDHWTLREFCASLLVRVIQKYAL